MRGARLLLAAVVLAVAAPAGAQAPGYRSAAARILAEGRAASTLIAHGSGGRLYAKFAPQFRAQVSLPQLTADHRRDPLGIPVQRQFVRNTR